LPEGQEGTPDVGGQGEVGGASDLGAPEIG
jgi:hypothetical protein